MKKIVLTVLIDGYDDLKDPNVRNEGWEFICITDDKDIKSDVWNFIYIDEDDSKIEHMKRKTANVKMNHKKYIGDDYDIMLYIDANMIVNVDLDKFLEQKKFNIDETDFIINLHPDRKCIYKEGPVCIKFKKDTGKNINDHIELLKSEGYPENNGLYETGFIILNNRSHMTKKLFERWYKEYNEKPSLREQMSFNYVMWLIENEENKKFNVIEIPQRHTYERSKWIIRKRHNKIYKR